MCGTGKPTSAGRQTALKFCATQHREFGDMPKISCRNRLYGFVFLNRTVSGDVAEWSKALPC